MPAKRDKVYTKQEVKECAAKIRAQFFTSANPMSGIRKILSDLNGKVQFSLGAPKETLRVESDRTFSIHIPSNTSSERDAFTIAHELGHYFLHTDMEKEGSVEFNRKGSNRSEWEANWFAADLLMPDAEFREVAQANKLDPIDVANHFGVSGAAARVRMKVLGLI